LILVGVIGDNAFPTSQPLALRRLPRSEFMAALPADLSKVDPAEAWKPWVPGADEPWGRKQAAHLFRRAAFGATSADLDRALKEGFPKTLERLMTGEPDAAELLDLYTEIGQHCDDPEKLRVWWLSAMVEGGHPLREKMTLFWHNHFATSYSKVRSSKLMYEQNVTIRKHALGHFRDFLLDMSKDTAMLIWLDSNRNIKGAPNENYAREVMELFSLGVGNYSEKEVQEAARAFTGWHHNSEGTAFENQPDWHDDGPKTLFGKTGNWAGADVVRLCCDHPACAKFLVGKLYTFLVSETPPPKALLTPLEKQFRESNYDIAALVNGILASRLFFSQHAYLKRVKWPVEYALGAARGVCPGRVPFSDLVEPLAKMGQALFAPPNVKGWRTGTDWLNSATLLMRNNFAETVALGEWSRPTNRNRSQYALRFAQPVPPPAPGVPMETTTPPPPTADQDPVALIYTGKPKDIPTIVKRMGELVYGESPTPAAAAKIVKFLNQPAPPPAVTPNNVLSAYPSLPGSLVGPPGGIPAPVPPLPVPNETPPKKTEPLAVAPPPREAKVKPYKPDLESTDFKARVREALHAMMCLPEYQLN
jgi:Protein of unknown function (DUF1800)